MTLVFVVAREGRMNVRLGRQVTSRDPQKLGRAGDNCAPCRSTFSSIQICNLLRYSMKPDFPPPPGSVLRRHLRVLNQRSCAPCLRAASDAFFDPAPGAAAQFMRSQRRQRRLLDHGRTPLSCGALGDRKTDMVFRPSRVDPASGDACCASPQRRSPSPRATPGSPRAHDHLSNPHLNSPRYSSQYVQSLMSAPATSSSASANDNNTTSRRLGEPGRGVRRMR